MDFLFDKSKGKDMTLPPPFLVIFAIAYSFLGTLLDPNMRLWPY